jgi:hypothetical protein
MKYTKIITSLVIAGAFVFSSSLMAADKKPKGKKSEAGQKGKSGRKNPLAEIGASKEQMKKIGELRKQMVGDMKKARDAKDRKAMQAAQKAFAAKLADILSEEQMGKYKKVVAEMRKGKGGKGKGDKKGGKGKKKKDS